MRGVRARKRSSEICEGRWYGWEEVGMLVESGEKMKRMVKNDVVMRYMLACFWSESSEKVE